MIATALAWLSGSKLGQYMVIGGAIALAVLLAVWRIFAAGKHAAQVDALRETVTTFQKRMKTDDAIRTLPPDARRQRMRDHWTSD